MRYETYSADQYARENRGAERTCAPVSGSACNQIDLAALEEVKALAIQAYVHGGNSKAKGDIENEE